MRFSWTCIAGCFLVMSASISAREPAPSLTPQDTEFFEKRIRPVLVESCQECHGAKKQQAGLRLDSRAALLKGADSGPVVIPGDPDNSPLVDAIRQTGALKMPPKSKLKPEAIEALSTWVRMGLPWPESPGVTTTDTDAWKRHWAFQPVKDSLPPAVRDGSWPATPIDRFILAKLEAKGLKPSPAADRRTLLRRVTFTLTGLPPTPAEIAMFESDASPEAWARVIDRLLASPHYGERWTRHWLDVSRYADTKGYILFDDANYPWAWTYRDYVIRAFNADLPYDLFIRQQLAADQLPLGDDRRALTALGFVTAGGRFINNQHDVLDDRIDVVSRGLLGLTVSCARCHDHKFDPIPQKDYYSLYGVFASSIEPAVLPLFQEPPDAAAYAAFEKEHQARQRKLDDFVGGKYVAVIAGAKRRAAEYLLAAHATRDQPTTEDFMLLADGGDLNPTMILRWQTYLARTRKGHHPVFAPWHALTALPEKEFAEKAKDLCARLLQADPARPINPLLAGALAARPPQSLAEAARLYAEVLNTVEKTWQEALQQAAAAKTAPPTALADPIQEQLRQVFHGPDAPPNLPLERFQVLALLPDRPAQAELQKLQKEVREWREKGTGAPPRAMVLEDLPTPYQPRVFLRGSPNNPGETVPRQFLAVLARADRRPFQQGSGRLELARAIASKGNPLTARVLVNRVWMHHFGRGLVNTPSDFGLRGEAPSHPELLDHLARWFMDQGWSIKRLHRLILLSAVYQQAALGTRSAVDPENMLLSGMNRRRLDFEATRDALLTVSGRLDPIIGGPSTRDLLSAKANRRTTYGFLDRQNLPGLYRTFDFPSPDASSAQRSVTTVAPQALFLMNHPFVLDCVRRLLQRPEIVTEKDVPRRVERLYGLLYGRPPSPREMLLGREYLGEGGGTNQSWERYTQALMLANEFVFID